MTLVLTSSFRLWLNLFHEKDRFSDYICNFVSDIKVLYAELYLDNKDFIISSKA